MDFIVCDPVGTERLCAVMDLVHATGRAVRTVRSLSLAPLRPDMMEE